MKTGNVPQDSWGTPLQQQPYKDTGLVKISPKGKSIAATKFVDDETILRLRPLIEQYYGLWVCYPDKLVEILTPPESNFKLEDVQQLVLRALFRYELVFLTATRGFSKSFVGFLGRMLFCIVIPRHKSFICAESQKQANAIAQQKFSEWQQLLPLLKNEIKQGKGSKTTDRADNVTIEFKNGSQLDLIAPIPSYRGLRRNSGLLEEAIMLDAEPTNEIVIPIVNIARRTADGTINPNEPQGMLSYVTSASTANNYAYEKAVETLILSVIDRHKAISLGFDYNVPVLYGMIDKKRIRTMKASPTFDPGSFAREMGSRWTGSSRDAWIDFSKMEKHRIIKDCELKPQKNAEYYLSVDVGRARDRTVFMIIKVKKKKEFWQKDIVDIKVFERMNLQAQALKLKRLDALFNFKKIVVDTNGLGQGLVDALVEHSTDPDTQQTLLGYNVLNRDQHTQYKDQYSREKLDKLWALFTNQFTAGSIHLNFLKEVQSGHVKFLIDEMAAKQKFMNSKTFMQKPLNERLELLMPYKNTTLLLNETSNLKVDDKTTAQHLKLIRINSSAHKDLFSALEYGLWIICEDEKKYFKNLHRINTNKSNFAFVS